MQSVSLESSLSFPGLAVVAAISLAGLLLVHGTAFAAVAQQVQSGTVANTANGIQVVNIAGSRPGEVVSDLRDPPATATGRSPRLLRGRIPIACANPCTTIEFERRDRRRGPRRRSTSSGTW